MAVDMSARGVTTRLKRASQLRRLCLSLAKAKAASQGTREPSRRVGDEQKAKGESIPTGVHERRRR